MKNLLKLSFISLFCFNFFEFNLNLPSVSAKDLLEISLDKEIKKGNFLIGLKQHLGKDNNLKEDFLVFKTKNSFLKVHSSNGVKHKSKEIKIILKSVPLERPLIIERLVSKSFASYESAKKEAQILEKKGLKPLITMPNGWELWLPIENKDYVDNNFKIRRKIIKNQIIPYLTNKYIYQKLDGPIFISSYEDIFINNINYGKNFYLLKDSYGTYTLVQKISFDKYLNGVLPHEIGSNAPMESLKAQAVIARTWAIYNSNRFEADKFHLCVTTQCQVYKPSLGNSNIQKAIRDTRNQILAYKDQPINAFYHASNGGISAKASESWKIKDYPYFIFKKDLIHFSKEKPNNDLSRRKELKNFLEKDKNNFFGKDHYLFRWNKKVSSKQLSDLLSKNNLLRKNSEIVSFRINERGQSGRITKLEIHHTNSTNPITLTKDEIRRYLNFLPSNLFIIDKLNDNLWLFYGGGFGHGVGLSQSAAIEMAKNGFSYQKILKHYYKNTEILNFMDMAG